MLEFASIRFSISSVIHSKTFKGHECVEGQLAAYDVASTGPALAKYVQRQRQD